MTPRLPQAGYEERYVAFVDILGFRSLVRESETNRTRFEQLLGVLDSLATNRRLSEAISRGASNRLGAAFSPLIGNPEISGLIARPIHVSMFSDSIVVSTPPSYPGLVANLKIVTALALQILELGALTRGGLVKGLVCQGEDYLFGPAVVMAYDLERTVAKYPRIIVGDEVMASIRDDVLSSEYHLSEYIRPDSDGLNYVDVLRAGFAWNVLQVSGLPLLSRLRPSMERIISAPRDEPARAKTDWFVEYCNLFLNEVGVAVL